MTLLPFRTTLCNLVHRKSRDGGNIFVGQFWISEHGVHNLILFADHSTSDETIDFFFCSHFSLQLIQGRPIRVTLQRYIFYKVAVKKFKSANNCLENHNRLSHVQASLVATFGSYGLQENAIFYKEAA